MGRQGLSAVWVATRVWVAQVDVQGSTALLLHMCFHISEDRYVFVYACTGDAEVAPDTSPALPSAFPPARTRATRTHVVVERSKALDVSLILLLCEKSSKYRNAAHLAADSPPRCFAVEYKYLACRCFRRNCRLDSLPVWMLRRHSRRSDPRFERAAGSMWAEMSLWKTRGLPHPHRSGCARGAQIYWYDSTRQSWRYLIEPIGLAAVVLRMSASQVPGECHSCRCA